MTFVQGLAPIFILDLAAGVLLAAAASCRSRACGNHVTGAAVLGCLAGLAAPLLRDCLLGLGALPLNRGEYLAAAVLGALAGALLGNLSGRAGRFFYWLDSLGLALAACVGTSRGLAFGLGLSGCLLLGVLAGLAGGLVRDMALGDVARAVEESLYATAAALGALLTLALLLYVPLPDWQSVLAGAALVLLLRLPPRRAGMSV